MNLPPLDIADAMARIKSICTVEILGLLEPADLSECFQPGMASTPEQTINAEALESYTATARNRRLPDDPKDIKKIREKHHSIARLIASGLSQTMAAQLTGYTAGYVGVLLGAPAMQELVSLYRSNYAASADLIGEKLRTVAMDAVDELAHRLEESPESIDEHALLGMAKLGLDRSGHGPTSHVNLRTEQHIFDHAELRKRDAAARQASSSRIIDIEAQPALPAPESDPEGNSP